MKSFKKIIALLLIIPILFQQVAWASSLKDIIIDVNTSAGSWQSPSTGTKYHYGGSYEFTFKGQSKFQPWVVADEPEIKIGCNGVSLKGGFLGLLGLNEIKDQLKDSGASLAWGVLLALQFTMPGIFQIFTKIREWATVIQRLLQNSCQIGTMLALSAINANKTKNDVDNHTNETSSGAGEALNSFMQGADEFFKKIDEFTNCSGLSGSRPSPDVPSPQEKCLAKLSNTKLQGNKELGLSSASTLGGISILGAGYEPPTKSINAVKVEKLSTFFSTGKIDDLAMIPAAELDERATLVKILRVFFGDLSVANESFKNIVVKLTNYDNNEGTFKADSNKANKELKSLSTVKELEVDSIPKFELVKPIIANPKAAANALINGIRESSNSQMCYDGGCYINEAKVFFSDIATPIGSDGEKRAYSFGIVEQGANVKKDELKLEWGGAYKESLMSIRTLIKNKSNVNPSIRSNYENDDSYLSATNTSTSIPLVIPNLQRYVDIIATIDRTQGAETAFSAHLKTMLAEHNAYFMSLSLIDLLYGKIHDAQRQLSGGGGLIGDIMDFTQSLEDRKNEIKNALKEIMQNKLDMTRLNDTFSEIEKNMKNERAVNIK